MEVAGSGTVREIAGRHCPIFNTEKQAKNLNLCDPEACYGGTHKQWRLPQASKTKEMQCMHRDGNGPCNAEERPGMRSRYPWQSWREGPCTCPETLAAVLGDGKGGGLSERTSKCYREARGRFTPWRTTPAQEKLVIVILLAGTFAAEEIGGVSQPGQKNWTHWRLLWISDEDHDGIQELAI